MTPAPDRSARHLRRHYDRGGDDVGTASEFQSLPARPGARTGMRGEAITTGALKAQSQIPNPNPNVWGLNWGLGTEFFHDQTQSLLAAVARLGLEESSLDRTLSHVAMLLRDAIPFERLHVLRLDRARPRSPSTSFTRREVEVTGHLIGDTRRAGGGPTDGTERSRLLCARCARGARQGAVWLTSSELHAFNDVHQDLLRGRRRSDHARATTTRSRPPSCGGANGSTRSCACSTPSPRRSTSGRSFRTCPRPCAARCRTTSWR